MNPIVSSVSILAVTTTRVYDLEAVLDQNRYQLAQHQTVYTTFSKALEQITRPEAGKLDDFIKRLQSKLDKQLAITHPPDTQLIDLDLR